MQTVNYYSNYNYFVPFKGIASFDRVLVEDKGKISKRTVKLISALNNLIEEELVNIKKQKILDKTPSFNCKMNKSSIFIKPVYSQNYPALLVEQHDWKIINSILIDRSNPNNFIYEKNILTDHGSATLKSYNSKIQNDPLINNTVDNLLSSSLEDILSVKILRKYFDDDKFVFRNGNVTLA